MRRFMVAAISAAVAVAPAGLGAVGASAATRGRPAAALHWPTVRQGAKGERVRTIQYLLTARGFREPADGVYGKDTTATVKRFQRANKLAADGSVGPTTWPKLVVTLRRGSRGSAVTALQRLLKFSNGYKLKVDGVFGAGTEKIVRLYQSTNRIKVDGIVGQFMWFALVSG